MNIEEAIGDLQRRFPEQARGKTALPGSPSGYYERMQGLDFQLWPGSDRCFYATSTNGKNYYIGIDPRSKKITCGPKPGRLQG